MKSIDIKKSVYALASVDGETATLTMYGDIYEKRPVDWWTDEPIEGDFILLDEFLDDLDEIRRCRSLTIRMNSYGGDANVANVIHNRLRELARGGMETVCIVDGVAMSGGSLIMCACDRVEVNPSSLIMIHNAWGFFFGGYNAAELLELAAQLDAFDKIRMTVLTVAGDTPETRRALLACDEMLANIVNYSKAESLLFTCERLEGQLRVQFSDDGVFFDPTAYYAEEKEFESLDSGGMGLGMIAQIASAMFYERKNGRNVNTFFFPLQNDTTHLTSS